jgi:hypothetical protein
VSLNLQHFFGSSLLFDVDSFRQDGPIF